VAGSETGTGIVVRNLETLAELAEAVRLQKAIWGFEDLELLPVRLFVVAKKVGGQVLGAFDRDRMIGFLVAIPGLKAGGHYYLHSHMMGVLDGYRDRRVGRMLKLAQRDDAIARGIDLVEWTFDPLEIKNAFFNFERLGAVVRRFVLNQYGTTSSHLHGGLPTDRCTAEWWVSSERVNRLQAGTPLPRPETVARVAVPNQIADIRVSDPALARVIQKGVSDGFLRCLDQGLAAVGFERGEEYGSYLFAPWDSK
jgi:predicted GNAT superfamily acetyltransferase